MATFEEQFTLIDQRFTRMEMDNAHLKKTVELHAVALGALVNKASLEKLNEKYDKLFDSLIAHDRFTNQQLAEVRGQIVELEGKFVGLQTEVRQGFQKVATRDEVNTRFAEMDARFEKIDARFAEMDARFEKMDARFEKMDARFAEIDARFEKMDARFAEIDARFEKIDARFAEMDARFEKIDARFAEIDARFETVATKAEMNERFAEVNGRFDRLEDLITQVIARLPG